MEFGAKYHCQITQYATGKKPVGTRLKEKKYKIGTMLDMTYVNGSNLPNGHVPMFVTNDGYILPKMYVFPQYKIETAKPKKHSNAEGFQDAEMVNDKPRLSNKEIKLLPSLKESSKTVVNFGLVGGGAGLIYAFSKGGNKVLYTIVGITAGAYLGNLLTKKKK